MRCASSLARCLTVRLTLGVGIAAVMVGRSALWPEPAADPWPSVLAYESPRYCGYDGHWFPQVRHLPRLKVLRRGLTRGMRSPTKANPSLRTAGSRTAPLRAASLLTWSKAACRS